MSYIDWKQDHEDEFFDKVKRGVLRWDPQRNYEAMASMVNRAVKTSCKRYSADDIPLLPIVFLEYLYETYSVDRVDLEYFGQLYLDLRDYAIKDGMRIISRRLLESEIGREALIELNNRLNYQPGDNVIPFSENRKDDE